MTLARKSLIMSPRHQLFVGFLLIALDSVCFAKPPTVIYYPAGATNAVPVMVWLHGYRSFPGALSDTEYFQHTADRLQIAIVGIPGTTVMADETLVWSEEPVADHHYIQDVLAAVGRRHKLNLERTGLFGFSQGAVVAGDIASRYPSSYRGALLLSPGAITGPKPATTPIDGHKQQIYIAVCGAQEHPMTVQTTRHYARQLRTVGAKAVMKEYEGMKEHTRPPDFKERFPEWATEILGLKDGR